MKWTNLVKGEIRKLTTTRMPLGFVTVLVVLAGLNGVAVAVGTDMDGSKAFISTGADQQSLVAFAANALVIAGLFGSIAVAREYANNTVVSMFLVSPRRIRAVGAQLVAVGLGGAALGVLGAALTVGTVALTLPLTEYDFLMTADGVARVLAAAGGAGACGAILGGSIGNLVRNTGGAVTTAVLALVIAPPLVVQLASGAAPWMPSAIANVASGVSSETSTAAAAMALALWAVVPAVAAVRAVNHRDVV